MKAFDTFSPDNFVPDSEEKMALLGDVIRHRTANGIIPRFRILRQMAKVRPFVKSVYPNEWKYKTR